MTLPPHIAAVSVDKEAQNFVCICANIRPRLEADDPAHPLDVAVEIRRLDTGELAHPHARLELSSHDSDDKHNPPSFVEFCGDYIMVHRVSRQAEVRRWSLPRSGEASFPVVWKSATLDEQHVRFHFVQLLWPFFLAIHVDVQETAAAEDPVTSELWLYRLDHTAVRHVASFQFPEPSWGPTGMNHLISGAKISPGEEGLVVIVATGNFVSAGFHLSCSHAHGAR